MHGRWLAEDPRSLERDHPIDPGQELTGGPTLATHADSLAYLTPFARMVSAAAVQMPRLLEAYRDALRRHGLKPPPGYGVAGAGNAVFSVSSFMDSLPAVD